jgi:uncharacterized protein
VSQIIVLYHGGCPDGFGAAWAFYQKYGDVARYEEVGFKQRVPDLKGKSVFIVDFCYPRAIMKEIAKVAASVVVLDHHKTSQESCGDLKYCHFDMSHSGAVLAWKYLFKDAPVPAILQHVEDRDLWNWNLPNSEKILSVIDSHKKTFDEWNRLQTEMGEVGSGGWKQMAKDGERILKYKNRIIKRIMGTKHKLNILGEQVPAVNSSGFQSEIGNLLSEGEDYAAVYYFDGSKYKFSLRSKEDGVDVSEIALEFGGGGHKNASGFFVENMSELNGSVDDE